jgi:hypothetical protein
MGRTTISLPDELVDELKGREDLNVSGVCRSALEHEIARRHRIDGMAADSPEIEVDMFNAYGQVVDIVRFTGRKLAEYARDGDGVLEMRRTYTAYLTGRGRFAFVEHCPGTPGMLGVAGSPSRLQHFDTLEAAKTAGVPLKLVADASKALGKNIARQLDI